MILIHVWYSIFHNDSSFRNCDNSVDNEARVTWLMADDYLDPVKTNLPEMCH